MLILNTKVLLDNSDFFLFSTQKLIGINVTVKLLIHFFILILAQWAFILQVIFLFMSNVVAVK